MNPLIPIKTSLIMLAIVLLTACTTTDGITSDADLDAPADDEESIEEPPNEDEIYDDVEDGELPLLGEPEIITQVTQYVGGIAFITDMVFAPDGRLFIAEKAGGVRVVSADGELQEAPVITFEVDAQGERGLLGLAIDPTFEDTGYIWAYFTYDQPDSDEPLHRIVRFEERRGEGSNVEVAFDAREVFLDSTILYGGALEFGPDGMLYFDIGSGNNIFVVNDMEQPHGKVHRATPTIPLGVPDDNPIPGSTIFATGFRNNFKIAFHPVTGEGYATMNGPDCDDEINRVLAGGHYGWRIDGLCEDNNLPPSYAIDTSNEFVAPVLYFTPTVSPTGIMFYTGEQFPEWQNDMFFCNYKGGLINRVKLGENGVDVIGAEVIGGGGNNCTTTILDGPDGNIYFSDISTVNIISRAE